MLIRLFYQCDEAKPTCKRCYTYGKPCPGYTDQFHFRHTRAKVNDKTSSASTTSPTTSTTRPVTQARGQQRQQQQQQQQQRQGSPQSAQSLPPDALALIRPPDPSHDDLSLCYFVRRFASPDRGDGFPGHFSFLPGLYDHYQSGLLETATLSVSQLAAYNQFGKEELLTHSLKNYGAVIRGLQEIINSGEQAVDDRVVATILLLCTWKVGFPLAATVRFCSSYFVNTLLIGHQWRRVGRSQRTRLGALLPIGEARTRTDRNEKRLGTVPPRPLASCTSPDYSEIKCFISVPRTDIPPHSKSIRSCMKMRHTATPGPLPP